MQRGEEREREKKKTGRQRKLGKDTAMCHVMKFGSRTDHKYNGCPIRL